MSVVKAAQGGDYPHLTSYALQDPLWQHLLPQVGPRDLGSLACTCKAAEQLVARAALEKWQEAANACLPPQHPHCGNNEVPETVCCSRCEHGCLVVCFEDGTMRYLTDQPGHVMDFQWQWCSDGENVVTLSRSRFSENMVVEVFTVHPGPQTHLLAPICEAGGWMANAGPDHLEMQLSARADYFTVVLDFTSEDLCFMTKVFATSGECLLDPEANMVDPEQDLCNMKTRPLWHPEQPIIAFFSMEKALCLLDVRTGVTRELEIPAMRSKMRAINDKQLAALCWSPDGSLLSMLGGGLSVFSDQLLVPLSTLSLPHLSAKDLANVARTCKKGSQLVTLATVDQWRDLAQKLPLRHPLLRVLQSAQVPELQDALSTFGKSMANLRSGKLAQLTPVPWTVPRAIDAPKFAPNGCDFATWTHLIVRAVDLRLMYGTALRIDLAEASITPGSDDSPLDINLSADAKFCSFRILDGEAVTWVFSTETGELVLETDDLYDGTKPFWHPEQPQFVQFMDASLTLYDLDTGESRILVTVPMMPEDTEYQADMNRVCCWSPCGKLVAYSYFNDTPEEGLTVAVARADGSGVLHAFHNLSSNFFGSA
ncbi:hypothetical protein WJX73_004810 [Symbiochloris irregularis]|uniref:Uncharacterized protein n=1 Tax=Symbiochloris irregularis TaxID=706552 RepID=A0AAW1PG36_9CHLO